MLACSLGALAAPRWLVSCGTKWGYPTLPVDREEVTLNGVPLGEGTIETLTVEEQEKLRCPLSTLLKNSTLLARAVAVISIELSSDLARKQKSMGESSSDPAKFPYVDSMDQILLPVRPSGKQTVVYELSVETLPDYTTDQAEAVKRTKKVMAEITSRQVNGFPELIDRQKEYSVCVQAMAPGRESYSQWKQFVEEMFKDEFGHDPVNCLVVYVDCFNLGDESTYYRRQQRKNKKR
ncbi:hypothetical protein GNI_054200 [Gregarina niphandrodes]|uniref:Transmembrane protein n=1 Tax=Gregarina niphandrodes TaxID=110365 RepID=A0A023B938_GRENI|nr:hypothetical protein GNI_054200 [Gregarina niphandrodes]EZG70834.1 hypothetical protein GNI_054200 [Gregarina niphandrodes]|eukprot:XP_011129868.1 hypothetical protein GNI_054200 [Gregarina niphandrodes]